MKKIYTLLLITSLMGVMSAQTTVDFTIDEGYQQGPVGGANLGETSNWGGSNWFIYPDAERERLETNASYSWVRWGTPFTVSDTEITFEAHFRFNIDLPAGKLISRFGFNDNGSNSGTIANIQLSTLNDGSLSVRKQGNTPVDSGAAGLTDFQQDDLVLKITLTLGADAASSSLSSKIISVTDGNSSGVGVVNGIPAAVFTAASSGGISGFIHAQDNINSTRGFLVDKVVMTQGNTLNNVTWTGGTNTDWATAANWDINTVPSATDNVIIPDVATAPIIGATTGAEINNLTITETEGINITAGGSLIVNGSSTGNITYNRTLATDNWYLISSPVVGQDKDAFVTASGFASGSGSNVGFADYNNTTEAWSYYQSGTTGSGAFTQGEGHSVQLATAGDVVFTGTFNDADASIAVTNNTNGFNLIGNPYLASVSVSELLGQANITDLLSELTVWLWDQSLDSYVQKNLVADLEIAPGQAFFISAKTAGSFGITESMQSHSADTFQRTVAKPEVELSLSNGKASRTASIYYIDGTTTGFDNGYDSSIFGGFDNDFSLYTHAVANGTGRNLGIQSLPKGEYQNMIIPVGVIAESGSSLEFSASSENLPEGIKIYLEDREENTFIRLDALNASYKLTTESAINGVGRFYLHTNQSVLNINDASLDNVSVFKVNNSLRIVGLQQGRASVKLFNVLGRQVLNTVFESNGTKDVSLPSLAKGVYIVHLETVEGALNKKIILE